MPSLALYELCLLSLDIFVSTIVLRIVLGWLLNYPRLLRLVIILASLSAFGALVDYFHLPMAGIYVPYLIIPIILVTLLNYLPDLTRIYKAASQGVILNSQIPTSTQLIPELSKTLYKMANRRMGAILAIAGKEDLDGCVSGGEAISAKINRSLLLSIFDTHCPRHDGAALIVGDQITRIGAVLPLASAELTDPNLGTRHLAALGLSGQRDAHIFVVSEERGSISHVHNGQIKDLPNGSAEAIEEALMQILKSSAEEPRKGSPWKAGGLLWLLALLSSVAGSYSLTLFRHTQEQVESTSVVSVEGKIKLVKIPETLTADEISPNAATIWVTLPDGTELLDAYPVAIDLSGWEEGKEVLTLRSEMVEDLPAGTTISRFEPEEVEIRLVEKKDETEE